MKKYPAKKSKTKSIVTILLLIFFYPLGVILMWLLSKWRLWIKIFLSLPLLIMIILAIVWIYILRPFQVSGNSMYPTIKDSEYTIVNLLQSKENGVKRGNIVIFKNPSRSETINYIGRIVGLPGEKIMISDSKVFINGNELNEPYPNSSTKMRVRKFLPEGITKEIPPHMVAILGDNQENSSDSRDHGFFQTENIIGTISYIY